MAAVWQQSIRILNASFKKKREKMMPSPATPQPSHPGSFGSRMVIPRAVLSPLPPSRKLWLLLHSHPSIHQAYTSLAQSSDHTDYSASLTTAIWEARQVILSDGTSIHLALDCRNVAVASERYLCFGRHYSFDLYRGKKSSTKSWFKVQGWIVERIGLSV